MRYIPTKQPITTMSRLTYREYVSRINEATIPIVEDSDMGIIVKFVGGEDGEFRIVTPSGLVKAAYAEEFYGLTTSEEEVRQLKRLSGDILGAVMNADMQTRYELLQAAKARDLFTSDGSFDEDVQDDMKQKVTEPNKDEMATLLADPLAYLSGRIAPDSLPTLAADIDEYLSDLLFYVVGKISAFLWWSKNTSSATYNDMTAKSLFAVFNKKIGRASRSTGWRTLDAYDAETDSRAVPGKTTYALWTIEKTEWPSTEASMTLHVGAIIDPQELNRIANGQPGVLNVSLFDEHGDPMKGYEEIRLRDLAAVLQEFPKKEHGGDISEVDEAVVYSLFEEFRHQPVEREMNEGLKDVITKIVGFFTGKNKKVKKLAQTYLKALLDQVEDETPLVAKMTDLEDRYGKDKAGGMIQYNDLKRKLSNVKSVHQRKVNEIIVQMDDLAVTNATYRKEIEKARTEAEKYAQDRKERKLAEHGVRR